MGGKPLFASAIKLVAHQNWGNKSLCTSVQQRLNKAMQPGDSAERVRVPAPGCRGPAQRRGLENRTRRGKGHKTERVPRSRQVPGVQPVCRFTRGDPRARTLRTGPEDRDRAANGVAAPRPPPASQAHAPGKVGVSPGPDLRKKPPAAHCLFPRPRGAHLRFHRAPRCRE